ncbi:MAG TPA: hypothetical protein PLK94_00560 [Alphaproteobacteria bacterium]|nr:hypothetical protein [Alphaproteobacteria bacterium]HOO49757.1 hypothetical protein [Alphaproteobacteria bacterium]
MASISARLATGLVAAFSSVSAFGGGIGSFDFDPFHPDPHPAVYGEGYDRTLLGVIDGKQPVRPFTGGAQVWDCKKLNYYNDLIMKQVMRFGYDHFIRERGLEDLDRAILYGLHQCGKDSEKGLKLGFVPE